MVKVPTLHFHKFNLLLQMMEGSEAPIAVSIWSNLSAVDFNHSSANYTNASLPVINNDTVRSSSQHDPKAIYIVCFLVLCCFASLIINILILSSVCFIRTRINNTLYISLSLAAADTFSLFFLGLGLFIFTLWTHWWGKVGNAAACWQLLLEGLRMGAIMTNMFHLAALGCNHYLGILLPLRLITRRNIQYVLVVLWTVPSTLLLVDMFLLEEHTTDKCDNK